MPILDITTGEEGVYTALNISPFLLASSATLLFLTTRTPT